MIEVPIHVLLTYCAARSAINASPITVPAQVVLIGRRDPVSGRRRERANRHGGDVAGLPKWASESPSVSATLESIIDRDAPETFFESM